MTQPRSLRRPFVLERDQHEIHRITTPDGVPLPFVIAPVGSRLSAFLWDTLIIFAGVLALLLFIGFMGMGAPFAAAWTIPVAIIASFLGWNFYFTWFELRWQGATPGKRKLGLRVIDAHGGQLSAESVIVRNLTRDLELYIPLLALIRPEPTGMGAAAWLQLLAPMWLVIFALLPLFNRDRQRIGDLVGGTLVVLLPKRTLLADLAAASPSTASPRDPAITFTEKQLSAYGIYELQVLEEVLRMPPSRTAIETRAGVAEKIRGKIGWDGPPTRDKVFLSAFYAALRADLERKMLHGKRREDKTSSPDRKGAR